MSAIVCVGNNDLIGVSIDYEICIVSYHKHLPFAFGLRKQADEFVLHGLRIEVFLRLVNDEWSVIRVVERQIEQQ